MNSLQHYIMLVCYFQVFIAIVCCISQRHHKPHLREDLAVQNLLENELYRQLPNGGFEIVVDPLWEIDRTT